MKNLSKVEYIWIDGSSPVPMLRSKTKVISITKDYYNLRLSDFPEWNFDGSSTSQATGDQSDCILIPVNFVRDPLRGKHDYLVLCEVKASDGRDHPSNTRSALRKVLNDGAIKLEPWIGFEQEYVLADAHSTPVAWLHENLKKGETDPEPQGKYYCGVGSDRIIGREIAEAHMDACVRAGLIYSGMNAEVMPGQWEYQIGYRGSDNDDPGVLNVCDHLILSRWLLERVAEEFGLSVLYDNKPVKGDWNGSGMHTNFSTKHTRNPEYGFASVEKAIKRLAENHDEHIKNYGHNLSERLTGEHETSGIDKFSHGKSDRGSSVRIPVNVVKNGFGYFEDRRPGANADPYKVAMLLCKTVCLTNGKEFEAA